MNGSARVAPDDRQLAEGRHVMQDSSQIIETDTADYTNISAVPGEKVVKNEDVLALESASVPDFPNGGLRG